MSEIEELQQAIDKLERLKDGSTAAPWTVNHHPGPGVDVTYIQAKEGRYQHEIATFYNLEDRTDLVLVIALHRTINSQLDMLHMARAFYGAGITGPESATAFAELALPLARAINGGAA